ncbi:MAG TPA: asparagine synthase (glutamine-hydrolyzing) [Vicinamibacterales bacterium]|jgi:asparagine synthase (glutamine-hydrolysing)|nr:asparagine synthase (glutamine-hydrolyzing) [Vicinamibacterales bacterium]
MCGIAGIIRWNGAPVAEADLRAMCGAMTHRGPDDEGLYLNGGVGLGMRRLSIIDLDGGHQPVPNEDRTVWVVFNGEIYNYRALRRELERRGHVFSTASDTETIVHLYEDYGPQCVDRLRGMFAIAIWDLRRRQVLLARDRLGIKPLYYAEHDGELIFASELKSLLQLERVPRALDWEAVRHLFTFLVTPAAQSIVHGVKKLEPARLGLARDGSSLRTQRYWDVEFEPVRDASEPELVEQLRALLDESVALHQVSDVPVGAFLSGGVDSSAVVASMSRLTAQRVKTFSVGFADADFSELAPAREVASLLGTEHHELMLDPDVVPLVEDFAWFLDEPFGDTSAIATYMVAKLAAEHVKVVLTGDGGDEIFAGYDKYVVEDQERAYDLMPASLRRAAGMVGAVMPEGMTGRRFLRHLALDGPRRYLDAQSIVHPDEVQTLFTPEAAARMAPYDPWAAPMMHLSAGTDWMSAVQYGDLQSYLPLDVLTKVDRMTMAHSIEARPPLLDHRLVEFAATVPPPLRYRDGTTKYLFKQAMRGVLPDAIIDRRKQGFAVPLARWFRGPLRGYARDVLLSERSRARGVLNPAAVERQLRLHQRGRDLDLRLWTMLSFELWCRRFLDSQAGPA